MQQSELLSRDTVVAYLRSAAGPENHTDTDDEAVDSNDFS